MYIPTSIKASNISEIDQCITSTFYGFSFSMLVLYHSCLSQIFLFCLFWGGSAVQTADLLVVQPAVKPAVVF